MALNLHHLRLFLAVADHGGFVPGAAAAGVTQPAVSRAVAALEHAIGETLFVRGPRGVALTAAGESLQGHARTIFAAERSAEEDLGALHGLRRGTLRIGASTTIATYWLPPYISRFVQKFPGVTVELQSIHTRIIVDRLRAHALDVALAEAPVREAAIGVAPWRTDEMVAIAAPSHRLAGQARVPAAALADELLILREHESGTRDLVLQGLRRLRVHPGRTMAVDGTETIKQLVAEGLGVGIVSRSAIDNQLTAGRLVTLPVTGLPIRRPLNRLTLRGHVPGRAAQAFLELIGDVPEA